MSYLIARRSRLSNLVRLLLIVLALFGIAHAQSGGSDRLRIGVVLPLPTGNPAPTDVVAEGARIGAAMAEGGLGGEADAAGVTLEVLFASSPTAVAAERAAERLVGIEGVAVLVGGLGEGQAEALARVAEEVRVPFFDIGGPDSMVRNSSLEYTFHIGASAGMFGAALAEWFYPAGGKRWFVVHEGTDQGRALFEQTTAAIEHRDGVVVIAAELEPGQGVYRDVLDEIETTAPDVVLALLPAGAQEYFYIQYESLGLDIPITGLPNAQTQTRDFYLRLLQSAPRTGAGFRAALWDTTLETQGARPLNESYIGRSGRPMDPVAWATYAAIKIVVDAHSVLKATDGPTLVEYLEAPDARFEIGKSDEASFDAADHQLKQPLLIVELQSGAELSSTLSAQLALATVVGDVQPQE